MYDQEDLLEGTYTLTCATEGCSGVKVMRLPYSNGYKLGQIVKMDASRPEFGRCHLCQRYSLAVTKAPAPNPPTQPKGWTKVPTK